MWLLRSLKVAAVLTPVVPAPVGYLLCQLIGLLYFAFNHRTRRNVIGNLSRVTPEDGRASHYVNACRVCITVVTNYYDLIRLRSVDRESILDLVEFHGIEVIDRALLRERGVIVLSAHVGNFSVMARLPAALGYQSAVIAEKVEPPALFNYMSRLRSAMGIEVIPPGPGALRCLFKVLRRNGLLLVAGDRDVSNRGTPVRFFNETTSLPAGPVILAMRTGAALIPAYTIRTSGHRSRVFIGPEIELQRTSDWDDDFRVNLQRMIVELEHMIASDPGQWAVLQSVWPPRSVYGRSEAIGGVDEILPETESLGITEREQKAG